MRHSRVLALAAIAAVWWSGPAKAADPPKPAAVKPPVAKPAVEKPETDKAPVVETTSVKHTTVKPKIVEQTVVQAQAQVKETADPDRGEMIASPPGSATSPFPEDTAPLLQTLPGTPGSDATMAEPDTQDGTVYDTPSTEVATTTNMPAPAANFPLTARFGPGFQLRSIDDEYTMEFHNLTQVDGRFHEQGGQEPATDTFVIPRQWFIFSGRLTKPYEYYVSIAEGFDNLNILDVFINIHYDDRLQFKVGRYKTPFTYEFYGLPINGLITPERSLFFNNFGINRDLGVMAWGNIADKRIDYALGIFNGSRNAFIDTNDAKDAMGYVNFKPFIDKEDSALQYFSIGGSMDAGNEENNPVPQTLRTNVATTGNLNVGIPFLQFNNNVREAGDRVFYSLHAAYYYQHLSLVSEWQSGTQDYAFTGALGDHKRVPVQSFYVQAGYFITGETVTGRGMVKPLRPFQFQKGKMGCGPGAWELAARFNLLDIGDQVFTDGLADPARWADRVNMVDLGINWYWTQYIKLSLLWEHAEFNSPVVYNPSGDRQINSDEFLSRLQIYF